MAVQTRRFEHRAPRGMLVPMLATRPSFPCIEFVNHASVWLSNGTCGVLTDPWYSGSAFHQGWALLYENDAKDIRALIARTDYIWISHEHPDHFSIPFFKQYRREITARGIRVLFQQTRDRRVCSFLREQGVAVSEMADGEVLQLGPDFSVETVRSDLYDSALLARVGGVSVFNLNDCPIGGEDALQEFAERHGTCDVLLTQFSYAAWKGGRDRLDWRQRAARAKLNSIQRQLAALRPRACIPFASFVRYSHEMNAYMNDAANTTEAVIHCQPDLRVPLIIMRPGERQALQSLQQSSASLDFWRERFASVASAPLARYEESFDSAALQTSFTEWQTRIRSRNSIWLMRMARRFLPLSPFSPVTLHLLDRQVCLNVDPLGNLEECAPNSAAADIALHSASLDFLFRHEFGFDTLFVNSCFEEVHAGGFDRFARAFAIGNLNAMGIPIGLGLLWRLDVLMRLLAKRRGIRRNLPARDFGIQNRES